MPLSPTPSTAASASRPDAAPNLPYYGDNLDILRRYFDDESADLAYLEGAG